MNKSNVVAFPLDRVKNVKTYSSTSIYDLFPIEVANDYVKYQKEAIEWRENVRESTVYEGYPIEPPCEPIREDMLWYVNEQKQFGVWVLNLSDQNIVLNQEFEFGWSPFVRKSTAPPHEPVHIQSKEMRHQLTWIVEEDGYGQYGMIQKDGTLWLPETRPKEWHTF
ncbi:hypothetical protein GLW08_21395 [Pontibacillus yanchengensis]|uniref:Uncharacterized protein n=2 Tax=Pontibacillus yanchengensis TaxID=462910 RepID=A0A6I5A566_9BACI|nr:hypothetical protein [Pontibacillus yanchengensis]MYL35440.1 hypothetical protein [Pontibacillus yanchengensis]MYL55859.1 hypothetical protein [Pontibacillus yanchengensis]